MKTNVRRLAAGAFGAVAIALTVASVAYACTVFRGTMTVSPSSGGSGTTTAVGDNSGMDWCSLTPGASVNTGSSTVGISVSAASGACGSHVLPDGTYDVLYRNGPAFVPNPVMSYLLDCMSEPLGTTVGSLVVSGGVGSTSVNLSSLLSNRIGDSSALCVSDSTALYGNMAPIVVL